MATHFSILSWRIPRTEEPRGLQSMGLQIWTQLSNSHTHTHTHTYTQCLQHQIGKIYVNRATLSLFLAVLGLCCCHVGFLWLWQVRATLHCGRQAPHCSDFSCGAQALGTWAQQLQYTGSVSVAPGHRLRSCGNSLGCSTAYGIFPDQGSNPCPLAAKLFTTEPPRKSQSHSLSGSSLHPGHRIIAIQE